MMADRDLTEEKREAKRVARDVAKLMKSAVANAQQKNASVNVDQLVISRAVVDEAPPLKRSRAQSMGRIFRVLKRACHVTIDLDAPDREKGEVS